MCGIVGYIGKDDCKEVILDGLAKLEYRGYDSAGLAIINEGIKTFKDKGRIANLRSIVEDIPSNIGIGHTRWATHGVPNQVNSHPHQSSTKRFTIVHNGVIENERELREKFLSEYSFKSDTDTEVIAALIEKFTLEGNDVELAIRHTCELLDGSYALGVIDGENPEVLYAAKNKSPMLIGVGDDFNMIGSDAMAMISKTNEFIEIEDEEFIKISQSEIVITKPDGYKVSRDSYIAKLDASDIDKGTYDYYMLKEIDEQPFVIRRIIQEYTKNNQLEIDSAIINDVKNADAIYIVAAGTSYNSGLVGKSILEQVTGIRTEVHIASEFVYNTPILSKNPLFIFTSQSGETADSRAVLVKVKKMGYKTLTITNVEGSTLSREANHTLLLHAGPEIAVASTKAYTAQIAVLMLLGLAVNPDYDMDFLYEFGRVANILETLCDNKKSYEDLATNLLTDQRACFYIGRHIDYYAVVEASLKLKEISYVQTEGFAAGELKHGTIALIEDKTPVIAIISQQSIALNTRSNVKEVESRGANSAVISMRSLAREGDAVVIDDVHPLLTPLVTIVPTQLIAYYTALHRGLDIDKPRNLAKSVTVE